MRKAAISGACLAVALSACIAGARGDDAAVRRQAEALLSAAGVHGGLIVHLGCGDGKLTAALGGDERCLVHGLESDPAHVREARRYIRSLDLYGRISVEALDGKLLPYTENLVNAIVVDGQTEVAGDEIARVLVPGGVVLAREKRPNAFAGTTLTRVGTVTPGVPDWAKYVKPPREGVDEWTHYLHDASCNPVSRDKVVAPPRHLQWHAGPRHTRSHEYTPSISSVVSSAGRLFYLADYGPISTLRGAANWQVVARDAYNGLLLWQRPLGEWLSHLCGWTQGPLQLQHRLVAVGERVYVTLGYYAPLSALDAATGRTVMVYRDTDGVEEIRYHRGILLLAIRAVTDARRAEFAKWEQATAQADSPLQRRETRMPMVRSFDEAERRAPRAVLAVEAATGRVLWKKSDQDADGLRPFSLCACGDRVYYETFKGLYCLELKTGKPVWEEPAASLRAVSDNAVVCVSKKAVTLLSPADGEQRWSRPVGLEQVRDVFLIGHSVWLGGFKPFDTGRQYTGPIWGPYFAIQHDLATGEVVREITAENPEHHHRCYADKATERFILGGRRGTEFLDLKTGDCLWHSWARGTCRYGVMPCNGLLYLPPNSCGCYVTVKLMGFNALAPGRPPAFERKEPDSRLEKGAAYDPTGETGHPTAGDADWPTYRADAQRSGRARCVVSPTLRVEWQAKIGGDLTAPVVADGKVFLARPMRHELLAVDAGSGKPAWSFTCGGPIDSPPTIWRDRVLVGCRDGFVYCLRIEDGELVWRFQGARDDRRIVAGGRLESASPIHGSVLVKDDVVAFTAGRSSYLDGGLDLYRLDPMTGKTLSRTVLYSPDAKTGQQPRQYGPSAMPGARSDILAGDDGHIYLRDLAFTDGGVESEQTAPHLFALTDFLDETWTHRSYWIYGTKPSIATGCSGRDKGLLYGRILAFDEKTVYGYGRQSVHWSNEFEDGDYRLFARGRTAQQPTWSTPVPVHVRAMVLSDDVLFIAGPPPPGQDASAASGLLAVSAKDGSVLARYSISSAPLFDGMAAAAGKLFVVLEDGGLLCMSAKDKEESE